MIDDMVTVNRLKRYGKVYAARRMNDKRTKEVVESYLRECKSSQGQVGG